MKIQMAAFAGEIPSLHPRLLDSQFAQSAINTKLENGTLTPIRRGKFEHHLPAPARTIYRLGETWLSWPAHVNVARGPVASERLYVTGYGAPAIIVDGETIGLALARPSKKLTAQVIGKPDDKLATTILYAYTNVTDLDEESEPSPLSDPVKWSEGLSVQLQGFETPSAARRVNRQRIYRSQTSETGDTTLYFIAERPASAAAFVDEALSIAEPIPSGDYNPPPDDMQGIISLPNGIMAAFRGRELCFSEPYIPHAWPEKYRLKTDFDIVGLGAFGSSVAILTAGMPYVASGTAPENMTMERVEVNLPCINARGIVDLGYSVAYPSHSGLVTISTNGAAIATKNVFTRDQWLEMNPYSFVAAQHDGRYMASYAFTDAHSIEQRGVVILDLSGAKPFVIRSGDYADAMFYEIESGSLFILASGQDIYEWDSLSQPFGDQTWISKQFVLPTYTNFGAILIEGEDATSESQREALRARNAALKAKNRELIAAGQIGGEFGNDAIARVPIAGTLLSILEEDIPSIGVTIIADGREVGYVSKINEIMRLPSGFQARIWQVAVRGNVQVSGIILANSPTEIAEG